MKYKYWEIKENLKGWIWIVSPFMSGKTHIPFKDVRELYKELKSLEKQLKQNNYLGWVAYTKIENSQILHAFRKLKAKPYEIDDKRIWFKRNFNYR